MMSRMAGKVALVTGSTQGLGEAIARLFAAEGADAVVVTGRHRQRGEDVARSISSETTAASFVAADLSSHEETLSVIEHVDAEFGRLDTLVNAAAITDRGTIVDTGLDLFDRIIAVNVRATFFLTQGAIKIMRREGIEGSIVNIGSTAAHGSFPRLAPYSISKGALAPFTRNVAHAMSRDRIRINTLNIGWMATPGEDVIQRKYHDADDGWIEEASAGLPFGRLLHPGEVAKAVLFLASEESGMMTGSIVEFDQTVLGAGKPAILDPDEIP